MMLFTYYGMCRVHAIEPSKVHVRNLGERLVGETIVLNSHIGFVPGTFHNVIVFMIYIMCIVDL